MNAPNDRLRPAESLDLSSLARRLAVLEQAAYRQSNPTALTAAPSRHDVRVVSASGHGLTQGRIAAWNGTTWAHADPATVTDATVLAFVASVPSAYMATLVLWGIVDLKATNNLSLATAFVDWYLAASGTLTATKPDTNARLVVRTYADGMAQIAPPATSTPSVSTLIAITGGNILAAASGSWPSITGISYLASTISAVPSAIPAPNTNSYPTGVGVGQLIQPNGTTSLVWVANAAQVIQTGGGSITTSTPPGPIPTGTPVVCVKSYTINVTGGGTSTIYVPFGF